MKASFNNYNLCLAKLVVISINQRNLGGKSLFIYTKIIKHAYYLIIQYKCQYRDLQVQFLEYQ